MINELYSIFRLTYQKILFFLLITGFIACSDQKDTGDDDPLPGYSTISFHLNTGTMTTKSGEIEDTVEDLTVLVFVREGNDYVYTYLSAASKSGDVLFSGELQMTDDEVKLLLVANIQNEVSGLNFTTGVLYEDVIKEITTGFSASGLSSLPMSGEIELQGIRKDTSLEVSMLRSVAAVVVQQKEGLTHFELVSMQAYRANDKIRVVPENIVQKEGKPAVSAPSLPADPGNSILTRPIERENETVISLSGLYIPESKGYISDSEIKSQATCLVIGGIYQGTDPGNTEVTYYRVDFKTNGVNSGEVLRNNLYHIIIEEVTGEGSPHPEDPDESSITVAFVEWSDSEHKVEL